MSVLMIAPKRDLKPWKEAIHQLDPNLDVELWPAVENKDRVQLAVCWKHPAHTLDKFPNLKAVISLGAGVDHLIKDESIPPSVQLGRLVTPSLKEDLADYALMQCLNYQHNTEAYIGQNKNSLWQPLPKIPKKDCVVGVMGLGEMGLTVCNRFLKSGYQVNGWSRTSKQIEGVNLFNGADQLNTFLNQSNILICLLPLTRETNGILDLSLFQQLKKPSYLINVGRGEHLVEEDLIYALDTQVLKGATLDVFAEEPLSKNHLFWNRPNITITPHIAAITDPVEGATLIIENYKRVISGLPLLQPVEKDRGY